MNNYQAWISAALPYRLALVSVCVSALVQGSLRPDTAHCQTQQLNSLRLVISSATGDATVICTRQWLVGRCGNHWLADKRFKLHSTKIWALQNFLRTYPVSSGQSCWETAAAAAYWLSFRRHTSLLLLTTFEVHKPSIDKQCHLFYGCCPLFPPAVLLPVEGINLKVTNWIQSTTICSTPDFSSCFTALISKLVLNFHTTIEDNFVITITFFLGNCRQKFWWMVTK